MKKALLFISLIVLTHAATNAQVIPQWVNEYGNDPIVEYHANDMVLDKAGNIFVTGSERDTSHHWRTVTLKYSSNGAFEWKRVISSAGFLPRVKTDSEGNAYICVKSLATISGDDFLTVKYSAAGNIEWMDTLSGWEISNPCTVANWDNPRNLFVDDSLNVYVTGSILMDSAGSCSRYIATVKYNPEGERQWIAVYPTYGNEGGYDVVVDSVGNVYVSGQSADSAGAIMLTCKYNLAGALQWTKRCSGNAMGLFIRVWNNQFIYSGGVTTGSGNDYVVIKYDLDGNEIWAAVFDAQAYYNYPWGNANDVPADMEVDKDGNVYMVGVQFEGNFKQDYTTVKFNSNGILQWTRAFDDGGIGWASDNAKALVLDDEGNAYVTGRTVDTTLGTRVITTFVYDSSGNTKFLLKYANATSEDYDAIGIGLDSLNHIYIAGTVCSINECNILTIKYGVISGVNELLISNEILFSIFPNPANDMVTISIDESMIGSTATITDITGRKMAAVQLTTYNSSLSTSNFASGVYFVTVSGSGGGSATKKLVIQK